MFGWFVGSEGGTGEVERKDRSRKAGTNSTMTPTIVFLVRGVYGDDVGALRKRE